MTVKKNEAGKTEVQIERGVDRISRAKVYTPTVNIIEHKDDIVLLADMPGVDEKSVELTLEKNLLRIHGSVEQEAHEKHHLVFSEYRTGDYERNFKLSDKIDTEKIIATVKDGVLKLVLPKSDKAKTKKIPITGQA